MRSFSKKLAAVLALAMVVTTVPAAQAKAADDFTLNKTSQTLYVNEGVNDKGVVEGGLYGNVQEYDFNLKNKPSDWKNYSYKWSSSNEKVATVVSGGITTAVGVGKATISCTITDKDGKVATTLEATVEVKANAADVEITNANDYDGNTVEVGEVVDLNRAMYDEAGNKTTKRGTYVTDYTRWIAKDPNGKTEDNGVVVDQSTGKYTFTEDAVEGDYLLYCETYQSNKYSQTTATSDPVTVTLVKENTFDVDQTTSKKFTVNFKNALTSLSSSDVKVERVRNVNGKEYMYNQAVKTVKLLDDKMSAEVEMFAAFNDATNYVITVKGFEDPITMTASVGKPVSLEMSSGHSLGDAVVTTGEPTAIKCTFRDINGIDVTEGNESVIFRLEKYATDGSYYLAGSNLTIKKEGVTVTVRADYQGYMDSSNKRVGQFSETMEFFAVDATPVVVENVADYSLDSGKWDGSAVKSLKVGDKGTDNEGNSKFKTLHVKVLKSDGKKTDAITAGGSILGTTTLSFEAINPDVCAITTDGKLVPNKAGTASFYVNTVTPVTNGAPVVAPFDVITIQVKEDSKLDRIEMNVPSIIVGDSSLYDNSSVKVIGYDQHGIKYSTSSTVTITCLDSTKTVPDGTFTVDPSGTDREIKFNGSALTSILGLGAGKAGALEFKVAIDGKEAYFTVVVQTAGDKKAEYVDVNASTGYIDASRTATNNDTKAEKSISFEVFAMNNGVKVDKKPIAVHPGDDKVNTVSVGAYVFKITKNGNALAVDGDFVKFDDVNKLTVKLSGKSPITNGAVTGSSVDYSKTGAGIYVFELYQCVESKGVKTFVQEKSAACTVVVDSLGAYYIAGQKDDTIQGAVTHKTILDCFTIKDRNNNEVKSDSAKFYVDYNNYAGTGTVYVSSITFYEEVATELYAAYTLTIDAALKATN